MKRTHEQILLDALRDGRPHSHHELYRLGVMVHSRVTKLRKQGYEIKCWREDGAYWYALNGDGEIRAAAVSSPSPLSAPAPVAAHRETPAATGALTLWGTP